MIALTLFAAATIVATVHVMYEAADTLSLWNTGKENTMSKTYDVIVTRDTTESCTMLVVADSRDHAISQALQRTYSDTDLVWEQDDTPNASSDHYVTHCEEEATPTPQQKFDDAVDDAVFDVVKRFAFLGVPENGHGGAPLDELNDAITSVMQDWLRSARASVMRDCL